MLTNRHGLATLALILLLAACQQATRPPIASTAPPAASAAWDAYASDFLESYFVAQPGVAVWAGRHEQIRANLRTPLPRTYVQIGHIVFGGLANFYEKDVPGIFATVADAQLQAEFRAANAGAIKAMKDLDAWFTQQEASATDAFALGADKFGEMLRSTERVDVPLVQFKAIAESAICSAILRRFANPVPHSRAGKASPRASPRCRRTRRRARRSTPRGPSLPG